jgi:hypothetical protein
MPSAVYSTISLPVLQNTVPYVGFLTIYTFEPFGTYEFKFVSTKVIFD